MESRNQDLDILDFMDWIKSIFYKILAAINFIFVFSIFRWKYIFLYILGGFCFSCLFYYLQVPTYVSQITISHTSGGFDNYYCPELINSLNSAIDNKSNEDLSEKLDISNVSCVKRIQFLSISKNFSKNYKDSSLNEVPFKIEIDVSDRKIIGELSASIISYLNNNQYLMMKKGIEIATLEKRVGMIDEKISQLNILKDLIDKNISPQLSGSGLIWGSPMNPVVVYQLIISLTKEKLEILEKMKLGKSFYLVLVSSNSISSKISLFKIIIIGVILSYIIGFVSIYIYGSFYKKNI